MRRKTTAGPPSPESLAFTPPYPPSWADHLQAWIERRPLPPWASYLVLLLAIALLIQIPAWIEGSLPAGTVSPSLLAAGVASVYFLTLSHYLNATARRALANYRPLLDVSDHHYAVLEYGLTKVPWRIGVLAAVVGGLIGAASFVSDPMSWGVPPDATRLQTGVSFLTAVFVQLLAFYWVAQVIRQTRAIDRIHRMTSRLNLFRRDPVYAFSDLTLRAALGMVLFVYAYLLGIVYLGLPALTDVDVVTLSLASGIAIAIFVLPLWRMHRLLAAERRRKLLEADERYSTLVGRFNRQLDKGRVAELDATGRAIASLAAQRETLARISTWPWRPESLRSLVSTIAAPIILYLASRLLGRFFGV